MVAINPSRKYIFSHLKNKENRRTVTGKFGYEFEKRNFGKNAFKNGRGGGDF